MIDREQASALFTTNEPSVLYATHDDEILAVANSDKAMSVFMFNRSMVQSGGYPYRHIVSESLRTDLCVILSGSSNQENDDVTVFVLKPEQTWRVQAYLQMRRVADMYRHSDGFEHLCSSLLGYSDIQVKEWLEDRRMRCAGETGITLFAVLTQETVRLLRRQGYRSFDLGGDTDSATVIWNRECGINGKAVLRADASALLPRRTTLVRFAVNLKTWAALFEARDEAVVLTRMTASNVELINCGLLSNVEVVTSSPASSTS